MEFVNSVSTGHWLPKLCTQLGSCQSVEDVQKILGELDIAIVSGSHPEAVLYQLQTHSQAGRLTGLVLTSGSWAQPLSEWLLESYPKSVDKYLSSVHHEVIDTISLFLTFLRYPSDPGSSLDELLCRSRARVELTPKVMNGLSSFLEEQSIPIELEVVEPCGFTMGTRTKQSERKQARKVKRQVVPLRPKDLQLLGIQEPHSSLEAYKSAQFLLDEMQKALWEYLSILRRPEVKLLIQEMFVLRSSTSSGNAHSDGKDSVRIDATTQEAQALPAAHPYVQPMKAALYFDSAKGFGAWRILISTRADGNLREARRRDRRNFDIYIKKIKELSNGHFSADNQKRLNGADLAVPVYEAKMTGDTRLVYQIDCVPEYDTDVERQVIKIFGIYTHAELDKRFWSSMGYQLAKKGKDYRRRCAARKRVQAGDNVFQPECFPPSEDDVEDTITIPELPKEDLEEIHSLLVLEKFVTLSKELWISILADLDVAHVFDVTPQEKEIIEHPYSCYVLGRSGTGKTTTMLFKMLGIERAYAQQSENAAVAKPRQIFVTQSRVLATRVEEYFSKLLESLAAAQKSNQEIKALTEKRKLQQEDGFLLFDADDDVTWKAALPSRFSLLRDEHFPLFLTFERLARLMEGDIELLQAETSSTRKPSGSLSAMGQPISYDLFFEKYWPHFPQDLTKNLDPTLVFNEILGVIEGSEESLSHKTRYLDQASYRSLSHRAQHMFANQRDRIYDLFKVYMKRKRQHGEFDTAERTHRILQAFDTTGVPGTKVDYLYIDEAQDNLLIEAMLLRSLCRNPNGLFWAGDTAQTIAVGSSFRFNDLKAFLYRLERRRAANLREGGVTQSELRTFQLVTNYRSHGGIVRCATAVIDLITHFWPYAIDALAPEKGVVDGMKPVFYSGWDTDTVRYEQFLRGDSGERIEFGARQCILVRDETARHELREQVGDVGVILTLYESKGLEFDDVLLYKFFEDSKVELGQWRVVLGLLDGFQRRGIAVPQFDEERHAGVCAELKFLYVAITRSRKNLWIVDRSDKAEPMKMLWESKGFIQTCTPGGGVPRLAVRSGPGEWAKTGRSLFDDRNYLQAMRAFERADMVREAKIAYSYHLRESARQIIPTTAKESVSRRRAFRAAAVSFADCAKTSTWKEARVLLHNTGDCYEHAGNCGQDAEDFGRAANAYTEASEYDAAVKLYRKIDLFDEAVEIIQTHRDEMDPALAESVLEVARLFYFRRKDYKKVNVVFQSVEEQLEYLEDSVLLDECHADVLVELGRYQEAANIHINEGRTMEAIEILLNDTGNRESTRRANDYILRGLWQSTCFAMRIEDSNTAAVQLLSLASKISYDMLSATQKDEHAMFKSLRLSADYGGLTFRDLGYQFLKRREKPQALLCLDQFFIDYAFGSLTTPPDSDTLATLENFHDYCRLFRETVVSLDLACEGSQKLFNFQPASIENAYRLRLDTWLHQQVTIAEIGIMDQDDEGIVVSAADLLLTLQNGLWQRLARRLFDENQACLEMWTPCLSFAMNRDSCWLRRCEAGQHLQKQGMTQEWFNGQLRGILLQIMLYQVYHAIPISKRRMDTDPRRHWIHKLYETLRPPTHYMGSEASLHLQDTDALAPPALEIVKYWCRDILDTHAVDKDRMTLSFLYEAAELCLIFDRSKAAHYLQQAPLLAVFKDLRLYYRPSGDENHPIFIIPELYQCLQAADVNFIAAGIHFVQQVVSQRITIDLNLLCHFFEFLTGSVILAAAKFNLHNVMLPRGWMLHLLRRISARDAKTFLNDSYRLVETLQQLLHDLIEGNDGGKYLLLGGQNLEERSHIRNLFMIRVCRALGLIGYNLPDEVLRQKIFKILQILNAAKIHHSLKRFTKLRTWGGVIVAVQASYSDSQLDDLVQLCSMEKQPGHLKELPVSVRRVFFKSLEQAPVALAQGPVRADAPEFVPRAVAKLNGNNLPDPAIDQPEVDLADLVDSRNLLESLASTAAPLAVRTVTEEQKEVAMKLLVGYRRGVRTRDMGKAKTRAQISCDSFFVTCLQRSKEMDWGRCTLYKKLYLGLVPRLLTCVDVVQSYAYTSKREARARWMDESEKDLEGLGKQITELNAMFKLSKNLRLRLDPSSALHKEHDVQQLKQVVGEVEELLSRVRSDLGLDVQFNLDLAVKAIVTERKVRVAKRPRKPKLNVEDLDGDEYYMDD